jgi:hypothetical protein
MRRYECDGDYELNLFYTDDPNFEKDWPHSIQQELLEVEKAYQDPNGLYKGKRANTTMVYPSCSVARHIDVFKIALAQLYRDLDELEAVKVSK